jgi:biopolymer transport protein ExbD
LFLLPTCIFICLFVLLTFMHFIPPWYKKRQVNLSRAETEVTANKEETPERFQLSMTISINWNRQASPSERMTCAY